MFNLSKKLNIGNRGSTLVTVLISIAFVSILGAIILFTTYTGFRIKVAQTVGEDRFYDAETAMEEIRAGIQNEVSRCISAAYKNVLITYDGLSDLDKAFTKEFANVFLDNTALFSGNMTAFTHPGKYDGGVSYNIETLRGYISNPAARPGLMSTLNDPLSGNQVFEVDVLGNWEGGTAWPDDFAIERVIIKNLRITYETTASDGTHLSIVDSDITIRMPDLSYVQSYFSFSGFADYALIATGVMDSVGSIEIDGSAYVGIAALTGGGSTTIKNGTFISGGSTPLGSDNIEGGDIYLEGKELILSGTAKVWANNIILGKDNIPGFYTLSNPGAITHAAGNLMLNGSGSGAVLSGRYFGFGNETPDAPGRSSIIVNGKNSTLDLTLLSRLYLAGQSFIMPNLPDVDPARMGQSMAVKSDQIAYLIPEKHIENLVPDNGNYDLTTNPIVVTGAYVPVLGTHFDINYDEPLWGSSQTLGDYIPSDNTGIQTYLTMPIGGSNIRLLYIFMKFQEQSDASRYFRDYFSYNAAEVNSYLRNYLSVFSSNAGGVLQGSGTMYTGSIAADGTTDVAISPPGLNTAVANQYTTQYNNRRITLLGNVSHLTAANPFEYIVETNSPRPPSGKYKGEDDKVYAYVSDTDINLLDLDSDSDINLNEIGIIVCYGKVTVNTPFDGLILCNGDVDVDADITSGDSELLRKALRSKLNPDDSDRLGDFLNIPMGASGDADGSGVTSWDYSSLVGYSGWRKS